jgi:two-component system, response regulator PdtaR
MNLPPAQPLKILVVEDDPLIASCVQEMLAEAEFQVIGVAASALEALSLLDHLEKPDLALIDIHLPGALDGIELACLLRSRIGIPTIFLSGDADIQTKLKAEAASPLAFLQKPFRPSKLFNTIQLVMASGACTGADAGQPDRLMQASYCGDT